MPVQVNAAYYAGDLIVRILPLRSADVGIRSPYHIALLLDTSGSMEGPPLAAVVRTLHLLIDRMDETDILTIIRYAHNASVVVNCASMNTRSKVDIHRIVDGLVADGGTNMEAAIAALGELHGVPIDAVFLMTDGHVNTGLTSSVGLLRLLSSRLPNGTPVNTLGFGTSHNAELLRTMAVKSRGSYTYADAVELIPAIIGNIIGGLADQVGSNAILTVTNGRCIELGVDASHPDIYRVGQLIAGKPQWVLFRGSSPPITLTWTEGGTNCQCEVALGTLDPMDMEEQVQRVRLVDTMNAVAVMVGRRQYEEAIAALVAHEQSLALSPAALRPFIVRLQAQVDEMLDDVRRQQEPMVDHDVDMLTRMVSNVTALGTQHGFFLSRNTTVNDPDVLSSPFSTSRQREATDTITQSFQDPN